MIKKLLTLVAFLSIIAIPALAQTNTSLVLSYAPYTEPATYVKVFGAYLDSDSNMITNATMNLEMNATNYTMPYNDTSNAYETSIFFTPDDIGNWTFNVYANKTGYDDQWSNITIKVRQPIFVNLRMFQDNNETVYKDNFAQAVLQSSYSCLPYITATATDTYNGSTLYYTDCYYHANYTDGFAQVRVYEKGTYKFYLISGYMTYDNQFVYPTVGRQTYKLSLGSFEIKETPTNINLVMNSCELNPEQCQRFYTSVFLWVAFLIIAGVIGIVAGKLAGAGAGFGVGILVLIGLVLLRLALLGY